MIRRKLGVVLLAVVTASCGLGDKQHRADAVVDSVDKLFSAGTAFGTLSVRQAVLEVPDVGRGPSEPAGVGVWTPPLLAGGVGIDFKQRRAVVLRADKGQELFDDLDYYGTRVGISERDARPWLRLRLQDLEEGTGEIRVPDDAPIAVAAALNPVVVLELASGALAGSIDSGAPDKVGDVAVTRYRARFDVEKTLQKTRERSFPEKEREAIETLLKVLTIKGTVNKGTAWVDGAGRLRRFRLELRVSRQRGLVFGVEIDISLTALGEPLDASVPADTAILEADSVVAFLRSTLPPLQNQAAG